MPRAAFWRVVEDGRVVCELCPHSCALAPGQTGLCRVRCNEKGSLILPRWGMISSLAVDPIEKKPLFHFLPGSKVFSVGFYGCNLRCPFCQNWEISQTSGDEGKTLSPAELVDAALRSSAPSLAFTYSEPLVHYEYVLEAARIAHAHGLRTVLVTNGYVTEGAAKELLPHIDAVNVDLKCFSGEAYRRVLGGGLEAVMSFIRLAAGVSHTEVTSLVVPGLDEWKIAIEGIVAFIAGLSPSIPLHLSAYHPAYRYESSPTSPRDLAELGEIARKKLDHVYLGNLWGEGSENRCATCGALLVRRRGYRVETSGLRARRSEAELAPPRQKENAVCAHCGAPVPFVL